jgi:hypothetical protein
MFVSVTAISLTLKSKATTSARSIGGSAIAKACALPRMHAIATFEPDRNRHASVTTVACLKAGDGGERRYAGRML